VTKKTAGGKKNPRQKRCSLTERQGKKGGGTSTRHEWTKEKKEKKEPYRKKRSGVGGSRLGGEKERIESCLSQKGINCTEPHEGKQEKNRQQAGGGLMRTGEGALTSFSKVLKERKEKRESNNNNGGGGKAFISLGKH